MQGNAAVHSSHSMTYVTSGRLAKFAADVSRHALLFHKTFMYTPLVFKDIGWSCGVTQASAHGQQHADLFTPRFETMRSCFAQQDLLGVLNNGIGCLSFMQICHCCSVDTSDQACWLAKASKTFLLPLLLCKYALKKRTGTCYTLGTVQAMWVVWWHRRTTIDAE